MSERRGAWKFRSLQFPRFGFRARHADFRRFYGHFSLEPDSVGDVPPKPWPYLRVVCLDDRVLGYRILDRRSPRQINQTGVSWGVGVHSMEKIACFFSGDDATTNQKTKTKPSC